MSFRVVFRSRNLRVRHGRWWVEHTQSKARRQQSRQCTINIGFGQQALLRRFQDCILLRANVGWWISADKISTCLERSSGAFFKQFGEVEIGRASCRERV